MYSGKIPYVSRFSARGKRRERDTLEQGLKLQGAPSTASAPLPVALSKPEQLNTGTGPSHKFVLPQNTSGQNKKIRRQIFKEKPAMLCVVPIQPAPQTTTTSISAKTTPPPPVPYSTKSYRKHKLLDEEAGVRKRPYTKSAEMVVCKKCGMDRKSEGHSQYYGNIFCPTYYRAMAITYEEWRASLQARGYGQKKSNK